MEEGHGALLSLRTSAFLAPDSIAPFLSTSTHTLRPLPIHTHTQTHAPLSHVQVHDYLRGICSDVHVVKGQGLADIALHVMVCKLRKEQGCKKQRLTSGAYTRPLFSST